MNARSIVESAKFNAEPSIEQAPHIHTISVYVNNKPGVLMRICQVFARRAYNIDALVVSHASNATLSRMTITVSGAPEGLSQIIRQLNKLVDVIHCFEHSAGDSVAKEMALFKIHTTTGDYVQVSQAVHELGGSVVDCTAGTLIVMLNGDSEKIDWALQVLGEFELVETVRTGKVVMARHRVKT
jgi:acetolactate synthase-1/3 small subunit